MQTIEDILSDWHNREKALIIANQFHKDELLKSQTMEAELLIKIEKLLQALRKIEQMSDCGSYEASIVRMKSIATESLKRTYYPL